MITKLIAKLDYGTLAFIGCLGALIWLIWTNGYEAGVTAHAQKVEAQIAKANEKRNESAVVINQAETKAVDRITTREDKLNIRIEQLAHSDPARGSACGISAERLHESAKVIADLAAPSDTSDSKAAVPNPNPPAKEPERERSPAPDRDSVRETVRLRREEEAGG